MSPTEMTFDEMENAFFKHEEFELAYDLEGTMTTLIDVPRYELPVLGLRIEGKKAATELYTRMLVGGEKRAMWAEKRFSHATAPNVLVREAYVWFNTNDGERGKGQYIVVIAFEDGKIAGERMYFDEAYAKVMAEEIGDDFIDFPGVSRLEESV